MWSRERHRGELEKWCDGASGPWEVSKVCYKTPDYMLSSAQDWHAGQQGQRELIWQATLGQDAVVFVTHPSCLSENPALAPSFWCGNSVLPRVAQWKDVLIAIHKLPDDDWLGFTHAYFPIYALDEHAVRGRWAFARKGEGYLALGASQGLMLITRGDSAYRELRSFGQHNVWLCHMGRATRDGSFAEFQERVLALDIQFDAAGVRCRTLRGDTLALDWKGPFLVNGAEAQLSGPKHYDNPYCCVDLGSSRMELNLGGLPYRLDFDLGPEDAGAGG
jgi:hypothetical protein